MAPAKALEHAVTAGAVGALVLPPFGGDASEVALGVAVLAWIVRGVVSRQWDLPALPVAAAFAVFALDLFLAAVVTVDPAASLHAAQYYPLRLAALFVGSALVARPEAVKALLWSIAVLVGVCVIDAIFQKATGASLIRGRSLDHGRVRLGFNHPNDLALFSVLAPLVAAMWMRRDASVIHKTLGALVVAGCVLLVLMSGSKTAILALAGGLGLVALALARVRSLVVSLVAGGVVLAGAYALNIGQLGERVQTAMQPPYDARLVVWSVGLSMFEEHPVLGRGTGTYASGYESVLETLAIPPDWEIYPEPIDHAHGIFMSALVERGVVGLAILWALLGAAGLALRRARLGDARW